MKRYLSAAILTCMISFPFQALEAVAAATELAGPMTYTERLCQRVAEHAVETRLAELDLQAMKERQLERLRQLTYWTSVSACHDDAKAVYREMEQERGGT